MFFQNPTTAMNEVVRSLKLNKDDEVLSTDHEYGAIDKTWNFICLEVVLQSSHFGACNEYFQTVKM